MQLNQYSVKKFEHTQLILLINLSLLSIILFLINPDVFDYYMQYYLLIVFVSVIGLPHGFFDYTIGKRLLGTNPKWLWIFTIGYTLISAIYFLLWNLMPLASLLFFLLLAAYHFGMEELAHKKYSDMSISDIFIIGSIPIVLPIIFHSKDVFFIFEQIVGYRVTMPLVSEYVWLVYFTLVLYKFYSNNYKRFLPYVLLIPCFVILPPLISFVLYFCFHHSLNHYIISIYEDKLVPDSFTLRGFLFTIVSASVVFSIFILGMLSNFSDYTIDIIIAKYTFILLACLTLPHLMLNIFYEIKK